MAALRIRRPVCPKEYFDLEGIKVRFNRCPCHPVAFFPVCPHGRLLRTPVTGLGSTPAGSVAKNLPINAVAVEDSEERLLEGKDLTLSTWNAASTQGTAIESPKESALCLSQAYLYGAQGRKTAVVLSAAPSPASCFTERTAVENKNLRLLEAGSHPDHILFGNSNGFNHANSTEQKKPSTRADGRDRGWQQRRGPARVQCTGQPWSDPCQISHDIQPCLLRLLWTVTIP
ncbi:hypothetical protein MG293_002166 [Ovis ammon polii]|uniref:Uncharacterized protein n=1 Tax=Ovis ammon polii TaxID=230172 RepID=A0AAD4YJJ6_OVIAM|nr:hypothetical protein MG293_002166 [Ovis ammon polii]